MFLSAKNIVKIALLSVAVQYAYSMELRPLAQFDFPAKVTIKKEVGDVKEEKNWDTDPVYIGGAELLFGAEFAPIRYGFGLGFKSAQKDGSTIVVPASLPIWGNISFGAYGKDWVAVPYAVLRLGYLAPLTSNGNWWELPLNFFANGGVGVMLPYNIGLEVNYSYSSMLKSFKSMDTEFRVSSARVGLQLSIGFELTHERTYKEDKVKEIKEESQIAEPVEESSEPESTGFDYSGGAYDTTEPESSSSESDAYSPYTPYNPESSESSSEDTANAPVAEEAPAEASAAEEPAAEEAAAEPEAEPAAEPEPEPEAEPAPEPEAKPAAKKTTKKASKKSKKSTKKSSKKSSKKSKKKK